MPPIVPLGGPERVAAPLPLPPPAAPTAEAPVPGRRVTEREPSAETYALSLTQAGLVGRAMVDVSPPPPPPRSDATVGLGGARKVERVLAPYGVTMLPAQAAVEARRRAVEAAAEAAEAMGDAGRAEDEARAAETRADADLAARKADFAAEAESEAEGIAPTPATAPASQAPIAPPPEAARPDAPPAPADSLGGLGPTGMAASAERSAA